MKESKQTRQRRNYFRSPNPGLHAYLEHVKRGSSEVYRTTFFRGKSPNKVLGDWSIHLNKLGSKFESLLAFEDDLRSKVGPLSVMKPLDDRLDDVDHYYKDILLSSKPIDSRAIDRVIANWSIPTDGVRIQSREETIDRMKKSTNSGLPLFIRPRTAALEQTEWVKDFNTENAQYKFKDSNPTTYTHCAVIGWRGQEGGPSEDDVKQRVVWMFPMEVNIQELRAYQPLIDYFQEFNYVPAWNGMENVDAEITKLFDTKGAEDSIVCTDFSKFDQHFNSSLQDCARQLLGLYLVNPSEWLATVFPIKYNIPLMLQVGKVKHGHHGMGSGSGGTNADETLAHRALQEEAALHAGEVLNPHSMCLGDDGILSYPNIDVDDVIRTYTSHGLDMNPSKQYVSKHDCVYLRRWHSDNYRKDGICVGVYSTYRALGRLMYQERFYDSDKWNNRMVALRQISILENCAHHPLFEEFIEYCMKGDRYRLGIDLPHFFDDIEALSKEAKDYMPDFLGYTKSLGPKAEEGINSWAVVKYLKNRSKK